MYRIELNKQCRIVSLEYTHDANTGIVIDVFPGDPIDDYKYIDGEVVYDPRTDRPKYDPTAPTWQEKMETRQNNADAAIRSLMLTLSKFKPGGGKIG